MGAKVVVFTLLFTGLSSVTLLSSQALAGDVYHFSKKYPAISKACFDGMASASFHSRVYSLSREVGLDENDARVTELKLRRADAEILVSFVKLTEKNLKSLRFVEEPDLVDLITRYIHDDIHSYNDAKLSLGSSHESQGALTNRILEGALESEQRLEIYLSFIANRIGDHELLFSFFTAYQMAFKRPADRPFSQAYRNHMKRVAEGDLERLLTFEAYKEMNIELRKFKKVLNTTPSNDELISISYELALIWGQISPMVLHTIFDATHGVKTAAIDRFLTKIVAMAKVRENQPLVDRVLKSFLRDNFQYFWTQKKEHFYGESPDNWQPIVPALLAKIEASAETAVSDLQADLQAL